VIILLTSGIEVISFRRTPLGAAPAVHACLRSEECGSPRGTARRSSLQPKTKARRRHELFRVPCQSVNPFPLSCRISSQTGREPARLKEVEMKGVSMEERPATLPGSGRRRRTAVWVVGAMTAALLGAAVAVPAASAWGSGSGNNEF